MYPQLPRIKVSKDSRGREKHGTLSASNWHVQLRQVAEAGGTHSCHKPRSSATKAFLTHWSLMSACKTQLRTAVRAKSQVQWCGSATDADEEMIADETADARACDTLTSCDGTHTCCCHHFTAEHRVRVSSLQTRTTVPERTKHCSTHH